eukprot:CAMPEP_0171996978 /NCGR_PEP_ID=MMETSP1041-20130122/437_1 /TAXON_ID=464988 /ORGANISM="Hemiselmis andersenii, Strain CCMP439" /LENGTH=75 /DNA_ID=CAMNT_0012650213 /DNA_START=420 /DNA_END=647 /DNA_ORIENTATION=-
MSKDAGATAQGASGSKPKFAMNGVIPMASEWEPLIPTTAEKKPNPSLSGGSSNAEPLPEPRSSSPPCRPSEGEKR